MFGKDARETLDRAEGGTTDLREGALNREVKENRSEESARKQYER